MELGRVTHPAAMAAGRWMGRGDREAADLAAVDAMRLVLNTVHMDGVVVVGEGEEGDAPMLYRGETLGTGQPPHVDIAADPIDGTDILSLGRSGALAVVAVTERGARYDPRHTTCRDKIAVGPESAGVIDPTRPRTSTRAASLARSARMWTT